MHVLRIQRADPVVGKMANSMLGVTTPPGSTNYQLKTPQTCLQLRYHCAARDFHFLRLDWRLSWFLQEDSIELFALKNSQTQKRPVL